jgi:hypothetical protein
MLFSRIEAHHERSTAINLLPIYHFGYHLEDVIQLAPLSSNTSFIWTEISDIMLYLTDGERYLRSNSN